MILSLLLAADAVAQPPGFGIPPRAAVVAGPTESGAQLFVWDEGASLCGSVAQRRERASGSSCGSTPRSLREPLISVHTARAGPDFVWGLVAPDVGSVELVTARGRRFATPTTGGAAYRGKRAGDLKFFLVEAPLSRRDPLLYVRLLNAQGALLAAVDESSHEHLGRDTEVARGRIARARWSLRAFRARQLTPLPGDEERVVTRRCVSIDVRARFSPRFPQSSNDGCDDPDFDRPVDIDVSRTCGPAGIQIAGLADRGVRLRAVLGDGSQPRVRLHALPARFGGRRAFALVLAPEVALRELVVIENGRRHVEVGGLGPGVVDCPDSSTGFLLGFTESLPRFGPGPPTLQLRDDGVLLCATLGLPDPNRSDCGRPPVDPEYAWIFSHVSDDATVVAGVVPLEVGSVSVVLGNGQSQVVPTGPAGSYSGRYRDLIRAFSLSLQGRQVVRRVVLYGLDGRRLASSQIYTPPTFGIEPTLLFRTDSGWRLGVGRVEFGSPVRRFACLQVVRADFSLDPFACLLGSTRHLRVTCSPKRTLLYGWLPGEARVVDVVTTRGRFSKRGVSARRLGIARSAFLVELRADEALRSVAFRG